MNRDELLEACFGTAALAPPRKWLSLTVADDDNPHLVHVRAVVGLDYRRVLLRHSFAPGAGVGEVGTMLPVAALAHLCVDPDHRGQGYARALVESALEEAASHRTIQHATLVSPPDAVAFFERFGFEHPELAPDDFLARPLRDGDQWPPGSVRLIGRGW
jgi:GNAT superfamily N-acetyltransferase